jgi:hypothetical protein
MPTPTYDLIATTTLAASTSSVTFGAIPQNYRDLILVMATFQTSGGDRNTNYRLNGDTGNNYNLVYMDTYGGSPSTGTSNSVSSALIEYHQSVPDTTPSVAIVQFMDYSATDRHKTALHKFGAASPTTGAYATRWASTAAVTSILLTPNTDYLAGSTFSIYGVIS